jgi:uncharacterized membrane protein
MRLSYLVRGFPGHPLHPTLTDATIGAYTTATVLGILAFAGVSEVNLTTAWWLAILVGLGFTAFAALTAVLGHDRYVAGEMGGKTFIATLVGFAALTVGGWLGGAVVFAHGMRVLDLVDEPPECAAVPGGAEKEEAEA